MNNNKVENVPRDASGNGQQLPTQLSGTILLAQCRVLKDQNCIYYSRLARYNLSAYLCRFLPLKDLVWERLNALETQHGTPNGTKPVYVETDV